MTTTLEPILDHAVINVADGLDAAADRYRRLGFTLTERGHHTLGSSNHLAIFGTNYLELLGFEPERKQTRADLWGHPLGLTGLVFKSPDPVAVHASIEAAGVPVLPPMHFSRPVDLPGGARDASFAVVRLEPGTVANGRVFFCHHETPDLVWRPEWQGHANGARDIAEFVIVSGDPARTARTLYGRMFGDAAIRSIGGGFAFGSGCATVTILDRDTAIARFRDALPSLPGDGSDRMAALVFASSSAASALDAGGVPFGPFEGGQLVSARDAGEVALAFKA